MDNSSNQTAKTANKETRKDKDEEGVYLLSKEKTRPSWVSSRESIGLPASRSRSWSRTQSILKRIVSRPYQSVRTTCCPIRMSCILWPFRKTVAGCRLITRSTIYTSRHESGALVSRLGLWEFIQEMKVIKEDGIVAIAHDPKRDVYHVIVRRDQWGPATGVRRNISAIYTLCRHRSPDEIDKQWTRLCPIVNALFPYLKPRLRLTELRMLQDIVNVSFANEKFMAGHVAAKLQYIAVFSKKNLIIKNHINERVLPIGQTPLMIAIQTENLVLVEHIVNLGGNILLTDFRLDTMLHYAALCEIATFKNILEKSKAHNLTWLLRRRNKKGYNPLHWCCYSGRTENLIEVLKLPLPQKILILEPREKDEEVYLSSSTSGLAVAEEAAKALRYETEPPSLRATSFDSFKSEDEPTIQFSQTMIDDLDTVEMVLGGSPIHWAKTRRLVETLLDSHFPTDALNFKKETPLHVMTRRKRLKCAVVLLARGVNILARDDKGNSPLHRAVQKEDISMVQALISFDADINGLNNRLHTARHIAATRGTSTSKIIVNVLHRVGAERCPPRRSKCSEDCAHGHSGIGTSFPKWADYENEKPFDDFMNPTGDNPSYQLDNIQNQEPARMITIDGGGTRGLFTCCALIEIERRLNKPLRDYFEWFVGTSSGALIASLIALGTPVRQIRSIYYTFKDKIFIGPRPYDSKSLEKVMRERMGPETKMSDIKDHKKLLITATLTNRNPAALYIFRNVPSPEEIIGKSIESDPEVIACTQDQFVWQACRASGAAPSYFRAYGPFIDGGILSNNPTLDGLMEFYYHNNALSKVGQKNNTQKLSLVLSLGTGRPPVVPAKLVDLGPIMTSSLFTLPEAIKTALSLQEMVHMMISATLQTDGHVNKRAQAWCSSLNIPFFRFNPRLSEDLLLNTTDDIEIVNGMWETKAYMYALRPYLDKLARTLEMIEKVKNQI